MSTSILRSRRRLSLSSFLLFALVVSCALSPHFVLAEDEVAVDSSDEDKIESAVEDVVEKTDEVKKEIEEIIDDAKDTVEAVVDAVGEAQVKLSDDLDEAASVIKKVVDASSTKTGNIVERIKNISKKDVKKLAAATIGAWGAASGVGWLMQQNKS